jgi:hypothetical protein
MLGLNYPSPCLVIIKCTVLPELLALSDFTLTLRSNIPEAEKD